MKRHLFFVVTTLTALSVATGPVSAEGDYEAGKTKSAACLACHGIDGNSLVPTFPKIAGQSASYIIKQLKAFKAKERIDETMNGQVQSLSEQDMADLGAYFSKQTVKPGHGSSMLGKEIYEKGNIKKRVLACKGCHGFRGAGNHGLLQSINASTIVEAPALSGQYPLYIVKQLKAFKEKKRGNDVDKTMQKIAEGMTEKEMEEVAKHILALH
jgi:cytochrome c553